MKKKALLSSVLTIALCLSLIAGSTLAIFTSKSDVNVAVTAGKIDVVATVDNVELGTTLKNNVPETQYAINNGNELALIGMVPGDYITFNLKVTNKSDVSVMYRTLLKVASDNGLWSGLEVDINGNRYDGLTKVSDWASLTPNTDPATVSVKISLPEKAGNQYQGKTCTVAYTVEAVQGNADVATDANVVELYTANDIVAFATNVNTGKDTYVGKTVKLMNDIDLAYVDFSGIGLNTVHGFNGNSNAFNGVFDGQGNTITNMTVFSTGKIVSGKESEGGRAVAGLFNCLGATAQIKNVNIDKANVTGTHYAGAIVGYMGATNGTAKIVNCHVTNSNIVSNAELINGKWDNGDKVGGIAGYIVNADISGCSVKNTYLRGVRDMGGIIGCADKTSSVTDCTVENVTIVIDKAKIQDGSKVNSIVGRVPDGGKCDQNGNEGTANITEAFLVSTAAELKSALNVSGASILLVSDIDMKNAWETVFVKNTTLTVDGNNHKITNLNAPLINFYGGTYTVKNLTVADSEVTENASTINGAGVILDEAQWANLYMDNCHVKNTTLTANRDIRSGALVGYWIGGGEIKNSSVESVKITNQKNSVGGIVGHRQAQDGYENVAKITSCTVSDSAFKTVDESWRVGSAVGTVSSGDFEINDFISSENTLYQNGAQNPGHDMFGRTAKDGKIIIDGGEYVADGVSKNEAGEYLISNAKGLKYCADTFNDSAKTNNKTFKLVNDIDMTGIEWTPWCNENQYFCGTFDGQGHTISNLTINDTHTADDGHAVGFIGRLGKDATGEKCLQNVIFDNANVSGYHYVGVAVGYNEFGKVDNVHVTNSKVTATCVATTENKAPCGDKAGALVGFVGPNGFPSVTNCSAANCTVTAARDAAQLIGFGYANSTFTNLSATNVTVTAAKGDCTHERAGVVSANALIGNGTEAGLTLN